MRGHLKAAASPTALVASREAGDSTLRSTAGFAKPMLAHLAGVWVYYARGRLGREPAWPAPCMCQVCRSRCLCLRQAAPDALFYSCCRQIEVNGNARRCLSLRGALSVLSSSRLQGPVVVHQCSSRIACQHLGSGCLDLCGCCAAPSTPCCSYKRGCQTCPGVKMQRPENLCQKLLFCSFFEATTQGRS